MREKETEHDGSHRLIYTAILSRDEELHATAFSDGNHEKIEGSGQASL
tara:strand:+ start:2305 stop:2448 length:144 start_codon:yes stop_codon:yes gene_type:complete